MIPVLSSGLARINLGGTFQRVFYMCLPKVHVGKIACDIDRTSKHKSKLSFPLYKPEMLLHIVTLTYQRECSIFNYLDYVEFPKSLKLLNVAQFK